MLSGGQNKKVLYECRENRFLFFYENKLEEAFSSLKYYWVERNIIEKNFFLKSIFYIKPVKIIKLVTISLITVYVFGS